MSIRALLEASPQEKPQQEEQSFEDRIVAVSEPGKLEVRSEDGSVVVNEVEAEEQPEATGSSRS